MEPASKSARKGTLKMQANAAPVTTRARLAMPATPTLTAPLVKIYFFFTKESASPPAQIELINTTLHLSVMTAMTHAKNVPALITSPAQAASIL